MRIVLASASPRRAALLEKAGILFDCSPTDVEEIIDSNLTPEENARALAVQKGDVAISSNEGRLVLTADTVVALENTILGKPVDEADAVAMLMRLAGRHHRVITGMALRNDALNINWSHVEITEVSFLPHSRESIEEYVARGESMDKAGAYAFQGGARLWVDSFVGSASNIIGLPLEPLLPQLARYGVTAAKSRSCLS